jgi:hypothetical protein
VQNVNRQKAWNELKNVPLQAFEGYRQVLEEFKTCSRRNQPFQLLIGDTKTGTLIE